MKAEAPRRTESFSDLEESTPRRETVLAVRRGFELLIQQKGKEVKYDFPFGGKYLLYKDEVGSGEEKISVAAWRKKTGDPASVEMRVDIGMRLDNSERVILAITPEGEASYKSLEREWNVVSFPGLSPTRGDLNLYRQVLELAPNLR